MKTIVSGFLGLLVAFSGIASLASGLNFGSGSLTSGGYGPPATADGNCVEDASDPYDPRARMEFGKDRGQCIDSHEERPPVVLSDTPDAITIANFRHARRWWIARIPKNAVQFAFFQLALFKSWEGFVGGAHGQARFLLRRDQPIILHEQRRGHPFVSLALTDFLLSAETFTAVASDSGLVGSVTGRTGILTRVVSTAERASDEILYKGGRAVMQTPLLVTTEAEATPAMRAAFDHLLISAIYRSQRIGFSGVYHYLQHNCVSILVETLDNAFPPRAGMPSGGVGLLDVAQLKAIVGPAQEALYQRGFVRKGQAFSLEDESSQGLAYLPSMLMSVEEPVERAKLQEIANQEARRLARTPR